MDQNFDKQSPLMNVPTASGKERLEENLPNNEQDIRSEHRPAEDGTMRLDDSQRVKVLSPGTLVFKRFVRNRLAIVGVCILVTMFLFSFLCPMFYPYQQTEIFYKYDYINTNYAGVTVRQDFVNYAVDPNVQVSESAKLMINSDINKLNSQGGDKLMVDRDGLYMLEKLGEHVFTLSPVTTKTVATSNPGYTVGTYDGFLKKMSYAAGVEAMDAGFTSALASAASSNAASFQYKGLEYTLTTVKKFTYQVDCAVPTFAYTGTALGADFEKTVADALENGQTVVAFGGKSYALVENTSGGYDVAETDAGSIAQVSTTLVFDTGAGVTISDELRNSALLNAYSGKEFQVEGASYVVKADDEGEMTLVSGDTVIANMTNFTIRDRLGGDTLSLEFKAAARETVESMNEGQKVDQKTFTFMMEKLEITTNEQGQDVTTTVLDENGNPVMEETTLTITRKTGQYEITCPQMRYLIDISAAPSAEHILGTDANGMDNLSRMMYGGRISLMVGFIVVFLEVIIGVIMGGIAGYFGGWIDTLIMRLVDIFRCIPSMPILIILAAFMDAQQVESYVRLMYMMAVLGFLGWAGIARMVRGQILSLREQEFMTAAEATGIRVSRRIFQHLVPNVMPQLIVTATSGLGSVILTESTLSFLGLGVKFPMATWGNIINTVTKTNENLARYTYIWIPVGLLICLTVIAFNFVGDGLRDAFDPKMKR